MKFTFAKGVHPGGRKKLTKSLAIEEMPASSKVYISLAQHIGAPAKAVVSKGDKVAIGTLIGQESGIVSSNIFSSVSGTVAGIVDRTTADGSVKPHVAIENDFRDECAYLTPLQNPTKDEILARIREAGVVGMGGAGFPTAVKLSPKTPVDTLIVNAAECEPYITCDCRIILEYTREFLTGVKLLAEALGGVKCLIGIEANKPECIHALNHYMQMNDVQGIKVCVCKTKYPQGAEKQMIYALTKRRVPTGGGLPADVGVIVQNVHTALSTYYAVKDGQPVFRRVMTVTGGACAGPANMWVRIGTPISELIEHCGLVSTKDGIEKKKEELAQSAEYVKLEPKNKQYKKDLKTVEKELAQLNNHVLAKLINGGPMMGLAMATDEATTTKTTSCLLMYSAEEAQYPEPSPCINCSKCVAVCPMNISPNMIESYVRMGDYKNAERYGATECIGCGCCAYICPAKRPLLQKIAYGKQTILANRKKQAAEEKAAAEKAEQERLQKELLAQTETEQVKEPNEEAAPVDAKQSADAPAEQNEPLLSQTEQTETVGGDGQTESAATAESVIEADVVEEKTESATVGEKPQTAGKNPMAKRTAGLQTGSTAKTVKTATKSATASTKPKTTTGGTVTKPKTAPKKAPEKEEK